MAIPFARSTRALHADSFHFTLIALSVAILLLLVWCGWFFFASITQLETSEQARLLDREVVVASFPRANLHRIVRGQRALFHPDGSGDSVAAAVPLVVDRVERAGAGEVGQVSLLVVIAEHPLPLLEPLSGKVDIEVEQLSPARLVLRNSGLFGASPKVGMMPQQQP